MSKAADSGVFTEVPLRVKGQAAAEPPNVGIGLWFRNFVESLYQCLPLFLYLPHSDFA